MRWCDFLLAQARLQGRLLILLVRHATLCPQGAHSLQRRVVFLCRRRFLRRAAKRRDALDRRPHRHLCLAVCLRRLEKSKPSAVVSSRGLGAAAGPQGLGLLLPEFNGLDVEFESIIRIFTVGWEDEVGAERHLAWGHVALLGRRAQAERRLILCIVRVERSEEHDYTVKLSVVLSLKLITALKHPG